MAKKVIRKNLVDQVCEILLESIRNGDYAVGISFPLKMIWRRNLEQAVLQCGWQFRS